MPGTQVSKINQDSSEDALQGLSEVERRQVVEEWNQTRRAYPQQQCIHGLFEAEAERTPDAIAMVQEERRLTYGELNRRANQLGHYLRKLGVKPDDRVAICVERGLEMLVGLLAILKAGGAYVPLDPACPADRLRFLLEDSAPVVLLTQAPLQGLFSAVPGLLGPLLDLSPAVPAWHQQPESNPEPAGIAPQQLAYIIYTSGSTGMPKGVMVQHGSVIRLVQNTDYVQLSAEDVLAQASTATFDAATFEIWGALLHGARLVCLGKDALLAPSVLAEHIVRQRISVLFLSTALFNQIACHAVQTFSRLRYLLFGGEKVEPRWAARVRSETQVEHLLHVYGPTETTTYAAWYEVREGDAGNPVPIGRPITNTQIYVLDAKAEPVAVGVRGELYIGDVGVARGYLNRAQLTAERFVADPFSREAGARLYRTGDMGRWLADGNIEFLERNDFQVKIRGFRVELGEIETRLMQHPRVLRALVLAREDTVGDKRLVAYVQAAGGETVEVESLRRYVAEGLPEYMVPTAYVAMESFPLTAHGKLDRKALPAPEAEAYGRREYEAPVSELEKTVARIWAEVLKLERVGRRDHFFELGGNSLLAVTLISRLRAALGIELAVKAVFAAPLLEEMAQRVARAAPSEQGMLRPVSRATELPLSYAQERLWFVAQFQGGSEAYHVPLGLRLEGKLNREALQRALDRIVWRHEALRTSFQPVEERTVQKIAARESGFALVEHDLRGGAEAALELNWRLAEEAQTPFDLEHGPLIRGQLIRLAEQEHVLAITIHHIVSDGWSLGIFFDELSALYGAFWRGEEDPLPELAVQYADYAVWERQWMKGEVLRQQAEYWETTLSGAPAVLELPADHARPAQQDYRGRFEKFVLDKELTAGLKELGKRQGTTLYMTVLAGWAALLARLSGQEEVVIGTPVANRGRAEIEGLIGFFVNTLAVRVDVNGSSTVEELLARVKEQALGAQQNQNLPFEQVVEIVRPERSLAHSPLFQVMLAWQVGPEGAVVLPGLEAKPLEPVSRVAKFDLTLSLEETGDKIVGGLEYATALFEAATIERYLGYFRRLLKAMVADERQAVDRLAILQGEERHRILYEWNDTAVKYPSDKSVHELFEEQVTRTPEATAVVFEEASLNYRELNRRANQLGHYLRKLGVKPDDRVAICVERGMEMIVALLAVLKAGGAYVPLDPTYPADRLRFMLEDCAPALLLTQGHLTELFSEIAETLPVLDLTEDSLLWGNQPESNQEHSVIGLTSEHLAYVIYTSGSTGAPKGVAMPIGAAVNLLCWQINRSKSPAVRRTLQFAAVGFDVSFQEIFSTLCSGGVLFLIDEEKRRNPTKLVRFLTEKRIQRLFLPNVALQMLAEAATATQDASKEGGHFPSELEEIIVAGEQLRIDRKVEEFFGRLEHCRLENQYGPTETHVASSFFLHSEPAHWPTLPPIGRPLANGRIYILDSHGEPVPIGVAGEIYIGGAGVARGYLNRPELTTQRFMKDPFVEEAGARMYRTGDVGRWLADGNIEFLGRNDSQIKIRGYRVELGEIEAQLSSYPGVREVAVVAHEDTPGEKRLVAYYTSAETNEAGAEQLRAHVAAKLPEYMVPGAFVRLESLPLTRTGKLDRKALPAPEGDAYASREYEAPHGETEMALAEIWAELLHTERVSRHDDFFALGGHSLLAVRVVSRIRQLLEVEVAIGDLFMRPTLSQFSDHVLDTRLGQFNSTDIDLLKAMRS